MLRHAKAKKFKPEIYDKAKNPRGTKLCMDISFQLFLYIIKVKYQED